MKTFYITIKNILANLGSKSLFVVLDNCVTVWLSTIKIDSDMVTAYGLLRFVSAKAFLGKH